MAKKYVHVKIHSFDRVPMRAESKTYPFDKLKINEGFEIDKPEWEGLTPSEKMKKFQSLVQHYNYHKSRIALGKKFVMRTIEETVFVIRIK